MERWCDANPARGPTGTESWLVGTLESTGLVGQIKHFYFDVVCQQLGKERMGELLIEDCRTFNPDMVVYTPIQGPLGIKVNPSDKVMLMIRNDLRLKVYTHLWDSIADDPHVMNRLPYSDCIGIVDSVVSQRYGGIPSIIRVHGVVDPKYFHDNNLERDIDVSFVGTAVADGVRIRHINFLKSNGVNIVMAGGQRQGKISLEEYAGIMQRSKISLEFSVNPYTGISQMKSRPFEVTTCGAMLMEDSGQEIGKFFEVSKDYISFSDPPDMLSKVHYYLEHDDERRAIAHSGHGEAINIYNARNTWGYIFKKIGFDLPIKLRDDSNFQAHEERMTCL